jgi:hypothetical protein
MRVRPLLTVAMLVGLLFVGFGPASANANSRTVRSASTLAPQPGTAHTWHLDFLVSYRATNMDSAAPVQWATAGSVTRWEVDVSRDALAVSWVEADGDFGSYTYHAHLSDRVPHRVHLDARQAGPDIAIVLTISGTAIWPITVPGQLGPIVRLAQSPTNPVRHATFTASVADVTVWNQ